jgi:MFS family permease
MILTTPPLMGMLSDRFGIRRMSAGGALLTLVATTPLLYLATHGLDLFVLLRALFLREMGMSGVGLPSLTAAHASVSRQKLPMATTSLNIVITQRVSGRDR